MESLQSRCAVDNRSEQIAVEIRVVTPEETYTGSGFIIGDGLVMTARHLLFDNISIWIRYAGRPRVLPQKGVESKLFDGMSFIRAVEIDIPDDDRLDIALLQAPTPKGLDWPMVSPIVPDVGEATDGIGWPNATASNRVTHPDQGSYQRHP